MFGSVLVGTNAIGVLGVTLLQQVAILPISIAMVVFYLDVRSAPRKRDESNTIKTVKVLKEKTTAKVTKKAVKTTKKAGVKKATKKKVAKKK